MRQQPDLKEEYIPFSHAAVDAVKKFHDGEYEKSLKKIHEMLDILDDKG